MPLDAPVNTTTSPLSSGIFIPLLLLEDLFPLTSARRLRPTRQHAQHAPNVVDGGMQSPPKRHRLCIEALPGTTLSKEDLTNDKAKAMNKALAAAVCLAGIG